MKFSNLRNTHNDLRVAAMSDPDYLKVLEIRTRFIENKLDIWDSFSWQLLNDFIQCREYNAVTKAQRAKIAELINKYNDSSLMWTHLVETRNQRARDLDRLMALTRHILSIDNLRNKALALFLRGSSNIRKMLIVNPLTEEQRKYICKIERLVGIWYDDLSLEENGVISGGENGKSIED